MEMDDEGLELSAQSKIILNKGLNYSAQDLIRELQSNSPVDTGLLRMWALTKTGDYYREIQSPASYVQFVNDGTGLFGPNNSLIYPKRSKFLVFKGDNGLVFARYTKGQKGQKFVEKSIEATSSKIEGYFIRAMQESEI